jgi:hypothetical protein
MKKEKKASKYSPGERLAILIFVISSGLYLLNIVRLPKKANRKLTNSKKEGNYD